jgi:hypothetical protein
VAGAVQLILAADVTDQLNDNHQLVPMPDRARRNLAGANGRRGDDRSSAVGSCRRGDGGGEVSDHRESAAQAGLTAEALAGVARGDSFDPSFGVSARRWARARIARLLG